MRPWEALSEAGLAGLSVPHPWPPPGEQRGCGAEALTPQLLSGCICQEHPCWLLGSCWFGDRSYTGAVGAVGSFSELKGERSPVTAGKRWACARGLQLLQKEPWGCGAVGFDE